jgi:hypothetical protein
MRRITACRARAILGAAADELCEDELVGFIDVLYALAEIATEAYTSGPGANDLPTDGRDLEERMQDQKDALMLAGLNESAAHRAVETHYGRVLGQRG